MHKRTRAYFHPFSTSAVVIGESQAPCPDSFNPWEAASVTQCTGTWLGPKASMDVMTDKEICTVIV